MFLEQISDERRQNGWIEVVCGSMFSGKTEELIRRLKRAQFANQRLLLIKPRIDNRYHTQKVVSHQGTSFEAVCVDAPDEIIGLWKNEKVVAIDEAQFFDNSIVQVCSNLAKEGARVIVAGLDMDFTGEPFGPMPRLLAIAEYVTKVHAICVSCGDLAQFSHRTAEDKAQVLVGAIEHYQPLCRTCFNKMSR